MNYPPEIILVCGGREFSDHQRVFRTLDDCRPHFAPEFMIVHGGARGADALAGAWAVRNGLPCAVVAAPWLTNRLSAGPIRNRWMLRLLKPDLVIAFPGGRGTADMKTIAHNAGIIVYES